MNGFREEFMKIIVLEIFKDIFLVVLSLLSCMIVVV